MLTDNDLRNAKINITESASNGNLDEVKTIINNERNNEEQTRDLINTAVNACGICNNPNKLFEIVKFLISFDSVGTDNLKTIIETIRSSQGAKGNGGSSGSFGSSLNIFLTGLFGGSDAVTIQTTVNLIERKKEFLELNSKNDLTIDDFVTKKITLLAEIAKIEEREIKKEEIIKIISDAQKKFIHGSKYGELEQKSIESLEEDLEINFFGSNKAGFARLKTLNEELTKLTQADLEKISTIVLGKEGDDRILNQCKHRAKSASLFLLGFLNLDNLIVGADTSRGLTLKRSLIDSIAKSLNSSEIGEDVIIQCVNKALEDYPYSFAGHSEQDVAKGVTVITDYLNQQRSTDFSMALFVETCSLELNKISYENLSFYSNVQKSGIIERISEGSEKIIQGLQSITYQDYISGKLSEAEKLESKRKEDLPKRNNAVKRGKSSDNVGTPDTTTKSGTAVQHSSKQTAIDSSL